MSIELENGSEKERWPPSILKLPKNCVGWSLDDKLRLKDMPDHRQDIEYFLPLSHWEREIVTAISIDEGVHFIDVDSPAVMQRTDVQGALTKKEIYLRPRKIYFAEPQPVSDSIFSFDFDFNVHSVGLASVVEK